MSYHENWQFLNVNCSFFYWSLVAKLKQLLITFDAIILTKFLPRVKNNSIRIRLSSCSLPILNAKIDKQQQLLVLCRYIVQSLVLHILACSILNIMPGSANF